jgi:hypothetical protein
VLHPKPNRSAPLARRTERGIKDSVTLKRDSAAFRRGRRQCHVDGRMEAMELPKRDACSAAVSALPHRVHGLVLGGMILPDCTKPLARWSNSFHIADGMGFPQLSEFVSQDPDHETYVFRSFSKLAARTLLQLQSELSLLEQEQERLDEASKSRDNVQVQRMMIFWQSTERWEKDGVQDESVKRRIELADEIAAKIERYCMQLDQKSGENIFHD